MKWSVTLQIEAKWEYPYGLGPWNLNRDIAGESVNDRDGVIT